MRDVLVRFCVSLLIYVFSCHFVWHLGVCGAFEINLGRACMLSFRSLRPTCALRATTVAHGFMSVYFMCSEAEISSAKLQWPYMRVL